MQPLPDLKTLSNTEKEELILLLSKQVEHPDHIHHHAVSRCTCCDADLSNQRIVTHEAQQVFDLPEINAVVTEHRAPIKICPHCATRVKATFPVNVTQRVQYGHRVQAFSDLFQIKLSQGTLNNKFNRGHQQLESFENVVKSILKRSGVAHFDESGIRLKKNLNGLHVASTEQLTCYHIDPKRGQSAMEIMGILPAFQGYAVHDHWTSYYTDDCRYVLCNAHHLYEVDAAKARDARSLGALRVTYFKRRYSRLLRAGRDEVPVLAVDKNKNRGKKKQHKVKNLHDRLVNHKKEVLAFLIHFSLPFDNNLAERDVRMVKVKQKISGCFWSNQGAKMFCRVQGYISTVRKQGHNVYGALRDAFNGAALIPCEEKG